MGRNKMIAKSCPKCEMQVAVASKACKCGHTFFLSRRGADALARGRGGEAARAGVGTAGGGAGGGERRTARVRRSQTQFYDAQHYQKQKRRSPKKRSLSSSIDESYKIKEKESATARARRRRALRRAQRDKPPAGGPGGERAVPLRPAQLARCQLVLQEINRKMRSVTWQPPLDL